MSPDGYFSSIALTDVTLRVADAARMQAFYQDVLGFACRRAATGTAVLGPPDSDARLIVLEPAPDAPARPRGTAGLFHVALLYPDRAALARALQRLLDLGVPVGSADHGVSEALYLSDPEGNGLELYADRPREAWPAPGADGQISMYTEALDLASLLSEAHAPGPRLPPATRVGHVHLSVADLANAERFYAGRLGFEVTQRNYPGALFLGRDGYHHHLGANIWRSRHAAVAGVLGLAQFTIAFRRQADLDAALGGSALAGAGREDGSGAAEVTDLDGLTVRLALADEPRSS